MFASKLNSHWNYSARPFDAKSALVEVMAWCYIGNMSLAEQDVNKFSVG